MKCRDCGRKFTFDEAAEEFNDYFDGKYDYSLHGWEGFCGSCAISGQEYEEENEDEDDIPVGCNACGGDYPNCKDSCPMFD